MQQTQAVIATYRLFVRSLQPMVIQRSGRPTKSALKDMLASSRLRPRVALTAISKPDPAQLRIVEPAR